MKTGGTGHHKQFSFLKTPSKHRYAYGGALRNFRLGRKMRPLSTKEPLHLVLKAHRTCLRSKSLRAPQEFLVIQKALQKYAAKFFVKTEQLSIQGDHIHVLIRGSRRSQLQNFFRVVAGQISQILERQARLVTDTRCEHVKGLWKYRPFTRIVKGYRAYLVVRDYIQLNEQEARGKIPYRRERLRGLSMGEWNGLWD